MLLGILAVQWPFYRVAYAYAGIATVALALAASWRMSARRGERRRRRSRRRRDRRR